MTSAQMKTIIGALVAIGLVLAVSYGFISQQTADKIQTEANQTLSNGQGAPAPNATSQTATPPGAAPKGTASAP